MKCQQKPRCQTTIVLPVLPAKFLLMTLCRMETSHSVCRHTSIKCMNKKKIWSCKFVTLLMYGIIIIHVVSIYQLHPQCTMIATRIEEKLSKYVSLVCLYMFFFRLFGTGSRVASSMHWNST